MITPELHVSLSENGLAGVLRVDAIRRDTLIQLAQAWADGGRADIEAALGHLAEVASGDATDGEVDAAVDAVDEAAGMGYPRIRLTLEQVRGLRRDLSRVLAGWSRSPRLPRVGRQRNGGAAA